MSNPRSQSRSPDGGAYGTLPGGRERRPGATRASRADGPRTGTAIDAALDGGDNLRLLFDHISDAVFATDAANRFTHWTASAAERIFGYSAAEAVGRPFEELLPYRMAQPGDGSEFFTELEAGRTWRGLGTVRVRDGREIWLESTVEPIMADGRFVGSVSVARDVTATIEAQQKLADEERFVEAVLAATEALVIVLDAQGRVERFNGACERLSGYRAAEVVGRVFWDILLPSAEVEAVRAVFDDLWAGAFPNSFENHWMTVTGALRLVRWENTCLTDDRGAVTHVIATGIDITDARRGDDALSGIETVGHLLTELGPTPAALDAVLGELETRMGYRFLSLYLADGPGLRLGAQRGYRSVPERLDAGRGVIGRVYRTGLAELVRDVRSDPDYVPGEEAVTTEIAAPLFGDDAVLGVLNIEALRPEGLTPDDLRLARAIADRLSSARRRRQTQEALRERVRLFAALAEFSTAVNAIREPERLAMALVDAVNAVVPSDTVVITRLDRGDGRYRVGAVRGLAPGAVGAIIEPGVGTAGRAISERAVVLTEHKPGTQSNAALRDFQEHETSWAVGVPLINEDVVLGVISMGRFESDATFTDAEREVFGLLGSHAALALANANLIEEVSALAIHDGLTGLYNRRHFDAELDHLIARFKRRAPAGNLAAIMFDLDHFGDFNRQHGHLAGDAVLRLFAGVLHERLRSSDLVARYGGEEFIVILEDSTLADAVRVAEEIRRGLAARTVPGADGTPLHATVSAGCAVIDPADPTRESLIGRADVALFMAKRAGRNQVVAA
jgi:diguanylate cyclase (GGDEF)-like protein/PAS domain S-box-containing protein